MLKLFQRLLAPPRPASPPPRRAAPGRKPGSRKARAAVAAPLVEPPALPDVVEGNEPSDWNLWEDSVAALDQHCGQPAGASSVRVREQAQATGHPEAWASVRRNRDL